jgi:hypothetical protein
VVSLKPLKDYPRHIFVAGGFPLFKDDLRILAAPFPNSWFSEWISFEMNARLFG